MTTLNASLVQEEFACLGVRSMQRMRRSQSTSRMVGKARSKVASAKEYLSSKHGLEIGTLGLKQCEYRAGSFTIELPMSSLRRKSAMSMDLGAKKTTEEASATPLPVSECEGKADIAPLPTRKVLGEPRYFYGQDIYHYEELYNLGACDQRFDDECVGAFVLAKNKNLCRHYYGMEVSCYEEFYNLVGGDHEQFDDECDGASQSAACQVFDFYGSELHCYEELYNLLGGDHEALDRLWLAAPHSTLGEPATLNGAQCCCRHYYCRAIHSYEELYSIAGADTSFDDEHH